MELRKPLLQMEKEARESDLNLNCIWHEKYLFLIWKAFQCRVQWRFHFLEYLFSFWSYWHFCIMQISNMMMSYYWLIKMRKYCFKNISGDINVVLFKLGTRDSNQTANEINPVTWLSWQHTWLHSLSVLGTNIPNCNPQKCERKSRLKSKRFLNRFFSVDDFSCKRTPEISVYIWKRPVTKPLSWQQHDSCHFAPLLT